MRQLAHTGIRSVSIQTAEMPRLAAHQAIIRILQVGICGSELHLYRHGDIGGRSSQQPFVSGHECVGLVDQVDGEYAHLLGQRVIVDPAIPCMKCPVCLRGNYNLCPDIKFLGLPPTSGSFTEYLSHPASLLTLAPDTLSDDEAVLCEPFAIALHAVELAKPRPAQTAAILGSGTMGLCVLIILQHMGVKASLCTDLVDDRLKMAESIGAELCANPKCDDVEQTAREQTDAHGYDMVFECAGSAQTYWQSARICTPGGRVIVVGSSADGKMTFDNNVARRSGLDIRMVRRSRHTLQRAIMVVQTRGCALKQLATHHFAIEEADKAFKLADEMRDGVIRAMVRLA
ncbi:MAG: zinc-dependent alcohol dehydrogenase [Armatimonadota bacterium]